MNFIGQKSYIISCFLLGLVKYLYSVGAEDMDFLKSESFGQLILATYLCTHCLSLLRLL